MKMVGDIGVSIHCVNVLLMSSLSHAKASFVATLVPSQHRTFGSPPITANAALIKRQPRGLPVYQTGGRYWSRTNDLLGVNQTL